MSVRQLLASHTSADLTEWMAYDQLQAEPPAPQQNTDDENEAVLLAMASRGKKKGQLKTGFDDLARRSSGRSSTKAR
jgi:hypothetical protein